MNFGEVKAQIVLGAIGMGTERTLILHIVVRSLDVSVEVVHILESIATVQAWIFHAEVFAIDVSLQDMLVLARHVTLGAFVNLLA